MVRGGVTAVLDYEIVDDKRKNYGQVCVCPDQRLAGEGGIAVFGEMQSESVVENDAGLIEAGHAFSDLEVDLAVQGKCKKVILPDDLVRDGVEGQTNELVAVHWRIIIENFNV